MIARRLGIDPYEMRMKNLVDLGQPFVPGESGIDSDLRVGLGLVAKELGYHDRKGLDTRVRSGAASACRSGSRTAAG